MEARVELITPNDARRYLAKNVNNYRTVNRHKVNLYARDMKSGNWQENGEAIKFNNRGELVDGQHRLEAIIASDTDIHSLVIRGIDNSVSLYDSGKNRSIREIALAEGVPARLTEGVFTAAAAIIITGDPRGYKAGSTKQYPTRMELTNFIKKRQHLWDNVYVCIRARGGNPITRKSFIYAAAFYFLYDGCDIDYVKNFFDVVGTGFPISGVECSSAIVLRNMLINTRTKGMDKIKMFHATVAAFNDFVNGVPRTRAYTKIDQGVEERMKKFAEEERKSL